MQETGDSMQATRHETKRKCAALKKPDFIKGVALYIINYGLNVFAPIL
jgi:hypothetical protein